MTELRRKLPNKLDFFLWGYCKQEVYKAKPTNLNELRQSIRETIAAIAAILNSPSSNEQLFGKMPYMHQRAEGAFKFHYF